MPSACLLENVDSLDEDRILRSFVALIRATLRTSFFQRWDGAAPGLHQLQARLAAVPELPKPVPYREIWVCAPRVEGIHLRFGAVARGGLRWSDRREDFRTEVLGLVKAQMVKNTVIVPVGSKGGFFVKKPPVGGDRDAQQAEGIACYRMFIAGLLDITDNLVEGQMVAPHDVVRHDGDDPYLVVAADKGTATFSDIANAISIEHGFWLGDAFASGGSNGYDHKVMGITAKGAWESVKRHFRALGRDCQTQDFTCVGIGDMSGDVFGNGMLLSRHIRLQVAFDHRHIFFDPNPDVGAFVRRARAHVQAAALELGGLRQVADLRGRRRVSAQCQVDPGHAGGAGGARPESRCHPAGAERPAQRDPQGAGRPAVERRHRHLREGVRRDAMPMSATAPTTRCASTAPSCAARSWARAATSA